MRPSTVLAIASLAWGLAAPCPAATRRLDLQPAQLRLAGAPAALVPADFDADGNIDLAVVVVFTEWDQIGITESTTLDEIEGLVEVMTVVPALVDRRELHLFRGLGGGRFQPTGSPLALDPTVLSLTAGPAAEPLLALTDEGIAAVRPGPDGTPELTPLLAARPVLAGSRTFVRDLGLIADLDGDADPDLLFPAVAGPAVYLWQQGAFVARPGAPALPAWEPQTVAGLTLYYPLPEVRDVDGDGLPELLYPHRSRGWADPRILPNRGGGHFGAAFDPTPDDEGEGERPELVYIGDLDGDGVAEFVTRESLEDPDAGLRQEIRQAKRPPNRYALHHRGSVFPYDPEPYLVFEALGYAFDFGDGDGDGDLRLPAGFQDLDGDGRLDLITVTLDFSIFQAVRILTVKSISLGLDFHVWCQTPGGGFRAVEGLDLSGRFRLDLNDLALGRWAQFEGDFDGDGRIDFLQMGRGRKVTLHRGLPGCEYPADPDLVLELDEPPQDLRQVRVLDLDGDGRSDLLLVQPERNRDDATTPPVRLDLYLSGGGG